MEKLLNVSSPPHTHEKHNVHSIMRDVVIALIPAFLVAVYLFGFKALWVTFITVISCVAFEVVWQKFTHQKVTITDLSAVVIGLLLAFNLPRSLPIYVPIVGIEASGEVSGVQILSHQETPGLGANMQQDNFKGQFAGQRAPLGVSKTSSGEGEIMAITGATITSQAVTEGFTLVILLFAGIRERIEKNNILPCLKGFPIALITAGFMAIAFLGFQNLIK